MALEVTLDWDNALISSSSSRMFPVSCQRVAGDDLGVYHQTAKLAHHALSDHGVFRSFTTLHQISTRSVDRAIETKASVENCLASLQPRCGSDEVSA